MRNQPRRILVLPAAATVAVALAACTPLRAQQPAVSAARLAAVQPGSTDGATSTAVEVLVSTSVESNTFRLERHADGIRFTASLDGGTPASNDSDHNWDLVADPGPVAADAVIRLDGGSFTTQGISTIGGRAGQDVTEVDVVPQHGTRVRATLRGGYWIAAWRGGELGEQPGAEIVLRRTDGTTIRVPAAQLR